MVNSTAELLLDLIRQANVPRTQAELLETSQLDPEALQLALKELLASAEIAATRKGKYALPEKLGLIAGRAGFQHNGTPILRPADGSEPLRIEEGPLRSMPEDTILARRSGANSCTLEAICSRGKESLPAFVRMERGKKLHRKYEMPRLRATAVPCDPRIPYAIVLEGDLSFVRNNEIALIAIDEYPEGKRPIRGHALRVLGNANSMLARMRAIAEEHNFPTEFPEAAEAQAQKIRSQHLPACGEQRLDLRDRVLFTIDGADSKDFDDAVSIEPLDNGGYRLGVHIADVSHYVTPGSPIDREARARGTSLYLPGCTVPMLPEVLSNDLCSLMPNADRLALSLLMDLSPEGAVLDHRLTPSRIRSRARLTYDGVNRFFEGAQSIQDPQVRDALTHMRALAQRLQARRKARGSIDFEMPEPKFVLNERCEPVEILCAPRGEAERLIEDFMLLANETVARLARDTDTPFVYRVHEAPDPEKILDLEKLLALTGPAIRLGDHPHPKQLQQALETRADSDAIEIIRRTMLRSLRRAQYAPEPLGHYALALKDYCHFTSPIRRYPDLVVHRMLKGLMLGNAGTSRCREEMGAIAWESSLREQESVKAERSADDMMKAAYMSHQTGRKFPGSISGVNAWGLYVTLENTVEGLVHISDLDDDYYTYDAGRQLLQGNATGRIFRLGMQVRVRVLSVSVERGEINFELADSDASTQP